MKYISASQIRYGPIELPQFDVPSHLPEIPDSVYERRKEQLCQKLRKEHIDVVLIYADREHRGNFQYFTGFDPRFEESVLIVHASGKAFLLLGTECYCMAAHSKIECTPILCTAFSVPSAPLRGFPGMEALLSKALISPSTVAAVIGWKHFYRAFGAGWDRMTSVPNFIIEALKKVTRDMRVRDITGMMIDPGSGLRITNDVHTIARMEYGSVLASENVKNVIENIRDGIRESDLANFIFTNGQPMTCFCIVSGGENTRKDFVSPTDYQIRTGDPFNVMVGMIGGETCRHGYFSQDGSDIEGDGQYYLEEIIRPYIAAAFSWYESIRIGASFGELYGMVESIIPKGRFGWKLNTGYHTGLEGWVSSPFYPKSRSTVKSGMIVQLDIIPQDPKYCAPNIEDGICIADEKLRTELQNLYPDVYARMQARRKFMHDQLGLTLAPEILPMSNIQGIYQPFMGRPDWVMYLDPNL